MSRVISYLEVMELCSLFFHINIIVKFRFKGFFLLHTVLMNRDNF